MGAEWSTKEEPGSRSQTRKLERNFLSFSTSYRKFCGVDGKDLNSGNHSTWEAEVRGL